MKLLQTAVFTDTDKVVSKQDLNQLLIALMIWHFIVMHNIVRP